MATKTSTNGVPKNRLPEATATSGKTATIEVPPLNLGTCEIEIVGTTELLVHNFSEKMRRQMLEQQLGKATKKKEKRDPVADYFGALYVISGDPKKDQPDPEKPISSKKAKAVHGIPAGGIKKAMIRGAKMAGATMTDTRSAFHVEADDPVQNLVALAFDSVKMHEGIVRLQGKTADLRFRPIYSGWSCNVRIKFNAALIGVDQLVNLLRNAGFGVGLCEHRPECDGSFGRFTTGAVSMGDIVSE